MRCSVRARISAVLQFTDPYGVAVTYYSWLVDQPIAVVQIAHGVGEHATRYAALAADLNRAGLSVYANDHRGHGQTGLDQHGGDHSKLGLLGPGGFNAALANVSQLTAIIKTAHPGAPVVLLGHSWGSLMAQKLVNRRASDYAAIVLTGTAYRMPGSMEAGDRNKRHKHLGTTGHEWLSRDASVSEAFVTDPLNFEVRVFRRLGFVDVLRLLGVPARNLPRDLPMLIMIGSDDTFGGPASVRRLADAYRRKSGLRDVGVKVYAGARHEVFNETNRGEVIADLVAWTRDRVLAHGNVDDPVKGETTR